MVIHTCYISLYLNQVGLKPRPKVEFGPENSRLTIACNLSNFIKAHISLHNKNLLFGLQQVEDATSSL